MNKIAVQIGRIAFQFRTTVLKYFNHFILKFSTLFRLSYDISDALFLLMVWSKKPNTIDI